MSTKATRQLRIGCGNYGWHFDGAGKVSKLVINIEVMKIRLGEALGGAMRWLSALPYPWCRPTDAVRAIPANRDLADIAAYLKQAGPTPATP